MNKSRRLHFFEFLDVTIKMNLYNIIIHHITLKGHQRFSIIKGFV
jgi:hypothetical protein